MKTIHFRSEDKLSDIFAVALNKNQSLKEKIAPICQDEYGDFVFEFDNSKFDHLYFECDGEKSGVVYPGELSIGVEYKFNEKTGNKLTYLLAKGVKSTGRVDNFLLVDEKNLAHRKDKSKKISVFVPESYDGSTKHDILYFFDAQNLFCMAGEYTENGDPYGSWELDVIIKEIHRQYSKNVIVVAIDNADEYRSQELFMHPKNFGALAPLATAIPEDDFSRGYLDGLLDFMLGTLHPFIVEKYCVSEENIGIGGSSMGGIAAFYCGIREEKFFSYVLSYSPAFGLYEISAFEDYFKTKNFSKVDTNLPKIHIYCGEGDPLERLLISSAKAMKGVLVKYGYPEERIFETYDIEKPHNEESWRLILPQSFEYLY